MKYFYCFIAFVVVLFAGCGRDAGYAKQLYLCNELEEKVTLTLFRDGEVFEYVIGSDSIVYFATIDYGETRAVEPLPGESKLYRYLSSFDSAIVVYDSQLYAFTNDFNVYSSLSNQTERFWEDGSMRIKPCVLWITDAYPILAYHGKKDCVYYVYDEKYFKTLDEKIKSKCYEIDYAVDVYFDNRLDDVIELEVFVGDTLSEFILMPNDTIYFTTIECTERAGDKTGEALNTGADTYWEFVSSIDSVNVFYNEKKYAYTKLDCKIQQLFNVRGFDAMDWLVVMDESKKEGLGWE